MAYTKYSLTPANNTATPPDGAPEGMLPSAVNDTMRDMMAQIRDCGDGIRDGTYTMTAAKITGGTITGSTINNSAIGGTTAASGKFTTLEATGVTTVQAGTVSAPALTTTGDTNTGIFFPAADTIAFTEGGAEAMRIDSSGRLLIGTTSGTRKLTVYENAAQVDLSIVSSTTGLAVIQMGDTAADNQGQIIYRNNGDSMEFAVNGAERMRFDSSGRLLINTTTARTTLDGDRSALVQIEGLSVDQSMSMFRNENGAFGPTFWIGKSRGTTAGSNTVVQNGDGLGSISFLGADGTKPVQSALIGAFVDGTPGTNDMPGRLVFYTTADGASSVTERMRITSGGEVYIAGTTDQGAYNLQCNGTGVWGAGAYVNGSDERIKDKIAPLDSGLDVVAKLNPVTYKYKKDWSKDQSTQTGFIAQELLTALEGKNYVDGVVQQGGEYMSVAYQNIIPILTKAIQEQQAMIEELKQEIAALKVK